MHSRENPERFYFQYQTEGLLKGISIQDFCISLDERCIRRQGLEVKEIMITLRQYLTIQLEKLKNKPEVKMTTTYHSVISTIKMQSKSTWEFFDKFFTNILTVAKIIQASHQEIQVWHYANS